MESTNDKPLESLKIGGITLQPSQISHYYRLLSILYISRFIVDVSVMGTGKTFTAGAIALTFGYSLLIVCPKTLIEHWINFCTEYGIPYHAVLSYQTLRSKPRFVNKKKIAERRILKHGLLERRDGTEDDDVEFFPTYKLKSILSGKVIVILDEAHALKNNSQQNNAAACMIKTLYETESKARLAILSATLFDNKRNTPCVLHYLGIIKAKSLFDERKDGKITPTGIMEAISFCENIDPQTTQEIVKEHPLVESSEAMNELCFALYKEVIKHSFISAMPPLTFKKDLKDGYYQVKDKAVEEELADAIRRLSKILNFNEKDNTIGLTYTRGKFDGRITKIHKQISNLKVTIIVDKVREVLETIPKAKVIVTADYYEAIDAFYVAFMGKMPLLVLTGKINNTKKRDETRRLFQTSPEHRILIGNTKVLSEGLSLHDDKGDAPRFLFVIPSFHAITLHQVSYRIFRVGTKSLGHTRFVYANVASVESAIIGALSRKKEVLEEAGDEEINEEVVYPGGYEKESDEEFTAVVKQAAINPLLE